MGRLREGCTMTDAPNAARPHVLRAQDHDPLATTATMTQRRPAITTATAGAQQLCMAYGVSAPGTSTGPHHHANSETAGYVLSGTMRLYFGEHFDEYLDVSAGEFVFVPAHLPHIEINISEEEATFVVARSSGEPIVVPIEADVSNLAHVRQARGTSATTPA